MFSIAAQHLDLKSGMHIIRLQNDAGRQHIIQIHIGHDSCPACGTVRAAAGREIDPKAAVADVIAELDASHEAMLAYAAKHGVEVR